MDGETATTRLRRREIRGEARGKELTLGEMSDKEREREKRDWKEKGERKEIEWKADIQRVVQGTWCICYQIKKDTGTVPSWRTRSRGEQEQSNICLNIRMTPGVIYARYRTGVLWTNIFRIHDDSFITIQKELGFRCQDLMNFVVEIWKLITAPCVGRKYRAAAERYFGCTSVLWELLRSFVCRCWLLWGLHSVYI